VIVPVRNGRDDVRRLLDALAAQTLPREQFEVVFADDGSTDGSTDGIETGDGWIRVAQGPPRNSYAARNRAVRASVASVLAFCDADCVPEPEWLEQGLLALESADVVAGRIRFILPERRTVWTLLDMDSSKDHEREVRNGTAETANLFLRRELFDRIGPFEEEVPEFGDFDFVQRCVAGGASLVFARGPVVWHPTRDGARSFLRAQWIYNRGYGERESRAGRLPGELAPQALVPLVSPMRSRRWWGRSLGPDRHWLGENGVVPRRSETLRALPIMYLLVPYLRAAAQFRGWLDGRRLRPAAEARSTRP
jgi:glycosyltransferase involved in cell wall biosynthesis